MLLVGINNFEMFINIYKNWPNAYWFPVMDKFMEMEETLMEDNQDVVTSIWFLDFEDNNNKLR